MLTPRLTQRHPYQTDVKEGEDDSWLREGREREVEKLVFRYYAVCVRQQTGMGDTVLLCTSRDQEFLALMSKFLLGSLTSGNLAFEKGDSLVMKRMRTCPGRAQEYNVGVVVPCRQI